MLPGQTWVCAYARESFDRPVSEPRGAQGLRTVVPLHSGEGCRFLNAIKADTAGQDSRARALDSYRVGCPVTVCLSSQEARRGRGEPLSRSAGQPEVEITLTACQLQQSDNSSRWLKLRAGAGAVRYRPPRPGWHATKSLLKKGSTFA